jgi:predicted regulator of Ras-like GTPase activity (Roadblock/LC7/MglB family)
VTDRSDRPARIRQLLAGLVDGKRVVGAAVVSRDGLPVQSQMTRPVSEETFCAMAAALLGAAEGALQEWADERPQRATAESAAFRLTLESLDADFILAVVAPGGEAVPLPEVGKAAGELRTLLKG